MRYLKSLALAVALLASAAFGAKAEQPTVGTAVAAAPLAASVLYAPAVMASPFLMIGYAELTKTPEMKAQAGSTTPNPYDPKTAKYCTTPVGGGIDCK